MLSLTPLEMSRSRVRLAILALYIRADAMAGERRMLAVKGAGWRAEIARMIYRLERTTKGGHNEKA
jgi:hypothetical protein